MFAARVTWVLSGVLIALGIVLISYFPQPFITYYCGDSVCSPATSGGIGLGPVIVALGVFVAVIAAIISAVTALAHWLPR
jgi:hypothetical protein